MDYEPKCTHSARDELRDKMKMYGLPTDVVDDSEVLPAFILATRTLSMYLGLVDTAYSRIDDAERVAIDPQLRNACEAIRDIVAKYGG